MRVITAIALLLSFIASTANAVVVGTEARFIRITKISATNAGDANRFHIGEVEAFLAGVAPLPGLDNANDLALASQGATGVTVSGTPQHGTDAALVDGVLNTGAATWSRQNPLPIVAQVDLGQSRQLGSFRIWQRTDNCCQQRLEDFTVELFADDGGGNPGAMVFSDAFPGQVPLNSFADFALPTFGVNPGVVGGIGNDEANNPQQQNLVTAPVVVIGAKTIRLVQNLGQTFQIAEIIAFENGTGVNVALQGNGGVATASSSGAGTNPTLANDGNLAQNHPNEWHSAGALGSFIQVDFASPTDLDSVHIYGRNPCCVSRQDDFDLVLEDMSGTEIYRQRVLGLGSDPGDPSGVSNRLFNLESIVSGELVAQLLSLPHTFEIDADAMTADSISLTDASGLLTTILDVNNIDLTLAVITGDPAALAGKTFQILSADSFTGAFNSIGMSAPLPNSIELDTSLLLVDGTISFTPGVPEPATMSLLLIGFAGAALRRRRRM